MSNFTEEVIDGVRTLTAERKFDCEHLLNKGLHCYMNF